MTMNRAGQRTVHRDASAASPPGGWLTEANRSVRRASTTAGVAILLVAALSGVGIFGAVQTLVTPGDAALTAARIVESQGLFRLGIASLFAVVALDVVAAWALYRVFAPVSNGVSMLAGSFRLAYSAVFLVAISELVGAVRLLTDEGYSQVFSADQVQHQALMGIETFRDTWNAGLVLFGLHLLLLGYLAYRSGYVPRIVGALLAVAGVGYVIDSLAAVLSPGSWPVLGTFTFVGELLLAIWLVVRGRGLTLTESQLRQDPIAVAP
jgi:hypothetical protein